MSFSTWQFILFVVFVLTVYWAVPSRWLKKSFLLAASWFFVFYHFPLNAFIYTLLAVIVFYLGKLISSHSNRQAKKPLLISGLFISILPLCFYKYREFLAASLTGLGFDYFRRYTEPSEFSSFLIPLGISFFVFELVHYLIEIYRGRIKKSRLSDFLLFVFFFPTLTAGPIKRFGNFQEQIRKIEFPSSRSLYTSLARIIFGFAKKILIANFLLQISGTVFNNFTYFNPRQLFIAVFAFSLAIYFDFSGYSDTAIGLSRFLGFEIPENFRSPYLKSNISSFWENWHISLTSWIKDYIFIPLGGSRSGYLRYLINIIVVFGVVGLWHGAAWNFVFWGIYHAIGMIIYQIYSYLVSRKLPRKTTFVGRFCSIFLTFNFVSFGWVLFKMTLSETFQFWAKIFSSKIGAVFLVLNLVALLIVLFSSGRIYISFFNKIEKKTKTICQHGERGLNQKILFFSTKEWLTILLISTLFFFTLLLFSESTAPYIYEQF